MTAESNTLRGHRLRNVIAPRPLLTARRWEATANGNAFIQPKSISNVRIPFAIGNLYGGSITQHISVVRPRVWMSFFNDACTAFEYAALAAGAGRWRCVED